MSRGKTFITGASGYIGTVLTSQVISKGYTVHGLSHTLSSDAKIKALGATPICGDFTSLNVLCSEASQSDIVFHLDYIHSLGWSNDLPDIVHVNVIGEGLKGSNKPFVITSGSCVMPHPENGEMTEEMPSTTVIPFAIRSASENHMLGWAKEGVGIAVICMPPYVYGRGGSMFLPYLVQMALKIGEVLYVDDGSTCTSAVHVDDAVALYLLITGKLREEKIKPGKIFNCTTPTYHTVKEMAKAIGAVICLGHNKDL